MSLNLATEQHVIHIFLFLVFLAIFLLWLCSQLHGTGRFIVLQRRAGIFVSSDAKYVVKQRQAQT